MKTLFQKHLVLRSVSVLLLVAFALVGFSATARAEAIVDFSQYTAELNGLQVGVNCGDAGYGELVELNGRINVLFYTIQNAAGGFVYRSKINGMHVTGVGQETGAIYQVNWLGMSTSTLSDHHDGSMTVDVGNLIGRGQNTKALVKMVFHVGVDADGNETVLVDQMSAVCH